MSNHLTRFRESTYPPPFPDGWYRVAASSEIRPGEAKHVQFLGEQIALFRSREDGRIAALDAFCPHQGANLAYGKVTGDRLQCPFHGWQLNGNGRVRERFGAEDRSFVHRHFEAIDYYGMVMIYRSALNGAKVPYRLSREPNIDGRQFVCHGQYDAGEVEMHIIEFAENSVDFRHFSELHGNMRIPWTNIVLPGIKIRHESSWTLDKNLEHISYFEDYATIEIRGQVYESTKSRALITFLGPGSIVKFDFHVPKIGEVTMFQTHTPVESLRQRVTFRWFASRRVPRILTSYVVGNWISQWRQDVEVWKRKIYRKRPLWLADDGPLGKMRSWYRQFYPDVLPNDLPGEHKYGN